MYFKIIYLLWIKLCVRLRFFWKAIKAKLTYKLVIQTKNFGYERGMGIKVVAHHVTIASGEKSLFMDECEKYVSVKICTHKYPWVHQYLLTKRGHRNNTTVNLPACLRKCVQFRRCHEILYLKNTTPNI